MSLRLGTFPVDRLEIGTETKWSDGTLTIDPDALAHEARSVLNVDSASIEITAERRVISITDLLECSA